MRSSAILALASVAAAALCGCPPPVTAKTVSLRLQGGPADASVYIDDQLIGPLDYVAAHGVALPAGVHHVTVQAPGFFPIDKEVEAKPNAKDDGAAPIHLDVKLTPIPD